MYSHTLFRSKSFQQNERHFHVSSLKITHIIHAGDKINIKEEVGMCENFLFVSDRCLISNKTQLPTLLIHIFRSFSLSLEVNTWIQIDYDHHFTNSYPLTTPELPCTSIGNASQTDL
jgi:hypothetical protein